MAKKYSLSKLRKLKTPFYIKKYNEQKIEKSNRGRPKKHIIPKNSHLQINLLEILRKPDKIQAFDEFSEIPKLILQYVQGKSSKKFDLIFFKNPSLNRINDSPIQRLFSFGNFSKKEKFFELMKIVIERTRVSLGLQIDIADLFMDIIENFCTFWEKEFKQGMKNIYFGNGLKAWQINQYFDWRFFEGFVEALLKWRNFI